MENLSLFRFRKAKARNQPHRFQSGFRASLQPENGKVEEVAGFKIHTTSMLFPRKGEENRVGRDQKRTPLNFPVEVALGDIMQFETPVLMLGQPRNAAAAKLLEQIEEVAGFVGKLTEHASI
ncbi:MAG TPA: hypothetical protein VG077_15180 [Verrucomicrobiae bacterium]|nr:hypothetical protein [Verrucomicrobiae bacterium]